MTQTDVEDAIVSKLAVGLKSLVVKVQSYEGNTELIDQFCSTVQIPAVIVVSDGFNARPLDETKTLSLDEWRFQVWVIHNKLRGFKAAMRGTTGVAEILRASRTTLQGQKLGLDIGPLFCTTQSLMSYTSNLRVMWSQIWTTQVRV